ncbi:hypothetical protein V7055_27670 [Bacillus thuringiensis]|uniref:hypothetical protein n=1 Tax=Bacillus thuringiensis TaxID=1428 RepID=UPI0030010C74
MEFNTFNDTGVSRELTKAVNELEEKFARRQVFQADGSAGGTLTCADICEKDETLKYVLNDNEELDEIVWGKTTRGRGANANAFIKDAKRGEVKMEANSNYGGRAKVEVSEAYAVSKI